MHIPAHERKRLADQLGMSEQYLYQCLTGRREMDPAAAMKAEVDSEGVIKRQMVCQKTFKSVWPDLQPLSSSANEDAQQVRA